MRHVKIKHVILLFTLLLPATRCEVFGINLVDGGTPICIKERHVGGFPKSNSIQATIEDHILSIVFLENLGQVSVEVTTASGGFVDTFASPTPNGMNICITNTGSYVVTFTLSNGDIYFGEFEVTD